MNAVAVEGYQTVIGLEVHVQLETHTKIFCGCPTDAPEDDPPNTRTCPVCLGLPGALPVLNAAAVEAAVKVGKALRAEIAAETRFHRKNYFYPDLPKDFQISQYDAPICAGGSVTVGVEDVTREVAIERAHLEEDPGSLAHVGGSIATAEYTLIDYNRAGTPLMEIVTAPDLRSPKEARAFLRKLEAILRYLEVFDPARDGSLRVDANISLVPGDAAGAVTDAALAAANRTEVKNISSLKGAEQALAYEVSRQRQALRRGKQITQETRHWDEGRGVTVAMRSKEAEKDYRYFSEADLPPLRVRDWRDRIAIPELPEVRRERFVEEYGIDPATAAKLTAAKPVADLFEETADRFDPGTAAMWIGDTLVGELHYRGMSVGAIADQHADLHALIALVDDGEITRKNATEVVLREMLDDPRPPAAIIEEAGLGRVETDAVAAAVDAAIEAHPEAVADVEAGEEGAINFLVGQVMQQTAGRADPETVNALLRERL
ncbi:MAG: Asp-tRNA(Asn)/Glu-tRNA(Gln) amidotransferase subunit GatB [Haloquadratum sp.]|nr:Asp-tRNA(Asn)/Glu-tRNA(Gln) amidotransferase subunit GatB [Haloferacaceae archaeon]MDR9444560.1 Asp-tRNA(Asn)/Glu-tRNA(Gln) amidotransferase subunit GatB [Haloquadratum sp.]